MKKLIAIFFAFILVFSNLGYAITTHYCGGYAIKSKLALGRVNLDCGMPQMDTACLPDHEEHFALRSKTCCEDHQQNFQVDESLQGAKKVDLSATFIFALVQMFLYHLPASQTAETHLITHPPPDLNKNILVLFQVFII